MSIGPVEYVVIEFVGGRFNGHIVPALRDLVVSNQIRILDIFFVRKDNNGSIEGVELDALDPEDARWFDDVDGELEDLLNDEDFQLIAEGLQPGSAAAILVWENVWAAPLADAVRDSGGHILAGGRIPHEVVEDARLATSATR